MTCLLTNQSRSYLNHLVLRWAIKETTVSGSIPILRQTVFILAHFVGLNLGLVASVLVQPGKLRILGQCLKGCITETGRALDVSLELGQCLNGCTTETGRALDVSLELGQCLNGCTTEMDSALDVSIQPLAAEALIYVLPVRRKTSNRHNYSDTVLFDFQQAQVTLLSSKSHRPALRPTQSPIYCVPEAFLLEIKQPECKAYISPPSRISGSIFLILHKLSWRA